MQEFKGIGVLLGPAKTGLHCIQPVNGSQAQERANLFCRLEFT
jgi:hypothetical protein